MNPLPSARRPISLPIHPHLAASMPMLRQAGLLFAIELVAHIVDYGFHLYLGRNLPSAGFASFQSYFSLAMLFITLGGILQAPVARYVAAPPNTPMGSASSGAVVRAYLWQGAAFGLLVAVLLALATPLLARATGLPPAMMLLIAVAMPLALVRPVLLGLLQGQGRFGALGAITLLYALARLLWALVGIGLAPGLCAGPTGSPFCAALTVPLALLSAVLLGLLLSRRALREPGRLPWTVARRGWGLSLLTLLMATAFMGLTSLDVVWVNRTMAADVAGAYARALVLRRIVSFVPLVTGVVLLPRVAAAGPRVGRVIALAVGLALLSGAALTALYAFFGGAIDRLAFGAQAAVPASWLVGMALAMTGYGLVTIWVNVFIATRPLPFTCILGAIAVAQLALYLALGRTPEAVIAILAGTGWAAALAGAGLYCFWLRPRAGQGAGLRLE